MRVCVFSVVSYYHGIKGGMEIHGKLLGEGMARRGHDVSVITTRHERGKEYEEKNGTKIYYLKNTAFGSRRHNWSRESIKMYFRLSAERPFDAVWSQSFAGYGLASLRKYSSYTRLVPILQGCIRQEVSTLRNKILVDPLRPAKSLRRAGGLILSYFREHLPLLSRSDRVITASRELIEDLRRWYGAGIARKAVAVFNGVDTRFFFEDQAARDRLRKKYLMDEKDVVFLSLGGLTGEKGHHLAVDAVARIRGEFPRIKLIVAGTGPYQGELEQRVRKKGLEGCVLFAGFVDHDKTAEYYNGADIFLMPTLRVEGLPYALLEAMACAKPVVASRIGGIPSLLVDSRNGLLTEPGDVSDLTTKMTSILANPSFAARLSGAAREHIKKEFSVEKMVDKTVAVLEGTY